MSTTYYVMAEPMVEFLGQPRIPKELIKQAKTMEYEGRTEPYFVVGTSFGNASSKSEYFRLEYGRRLLQQLAENVGRNDAPQTDYDTFAHITYDDFVHIVESGMPYFSKWDENSPLLLHDKSLRFYWHTAGREFWEQLPRDIPVENFYDPKINTLGDLFDALYGTDSYMDAIENTRQGTYKDDPTQFTSWWLRYK